MLTSFVILYKNEKKISQKIFIQSQIEWFLEKISHKEINQHSQYNNPGANKSKFYLFL